jgi:hypothetical protein
MRDTANGRPTPKDRRRWGAPSLPIAAYRSDTLTAGKSR